MKKTVSLILGVILVLSVFSSLSIFASAASEETTDYFNAISSGVNCEKDDPLASAALPQEFSGETLPAPELTKAINYFGDVIRVSWEKVEGASSYIVYRSEATALKNPKVIGETKGLYFDDPDVVNSYKYTYTVQAKASNGVTSDYNTKGLTATCIISPAGISVANVYNGVLIKWSYVPNVEKYRLYRRIVTVDANGKEVYGGWQVALTTSDGKLTECRDTNKSKMKSGTIYQYCVRSMVGSEQGPINVSQTTILYLTAPVYTAKVVNGGINLSWSKVPGADYYRIYRRLKTTDSWTKLKNTTGLTYTDKTVKNGTKYIYTVRAFINGTESTYRCSSFTSKTVTYKLLAPTVKVALSFGDVEVTWNKITGADKYYVCRKTSSTSWKTIATTTAVSYVDKTAKIGTTYYYTVKPVGGETVGSFNSTGVKISTPKDPLISLNKTTATVDVKSSVTLTAKTAPSSAAVSWKSSDTSIAKVSSAGKVTGVKAGTATITASFSYGGKTYKATCKVTVRKESDKDRYNKLVTYLQNNGEMVKTYYSGEETFFAVISYTDGYVYFYIADYFGDDNLHCDDIFRYEYGDEIVLQTGSLESDVYDYADFVSTIEVAKYNKDYNYSVKIKSDIQNEEVKDAATAAYFDTVDIGFAYWDKMLKSQFGFGMKGIGFSSYY